MTIDVLTGDSLFDQNRRVCPKCNHKNTTTVAFGMARYHRCWKCDHKWETSRVGKKEE